MSLHLVPKDPLRNLSTQIEVNDDDKEIQVLYVIFLVMYHIEKRLFEIFESEIDESWLRYEV